MVRRRAPHALFARARTPPRATHQTCLATTGAYQNVLWSLLATSRGADAPPPTAADVVPVQTLAAVCAGATSGLLTTPLDVVKTRLQTAPFEPGQPKPTFRSVAAQLLRDEGASGFLRGVVPRVSSAMVRAAPAHLSRVAVPLMRVARRTAVGHLYGERVRASQTAQRSRGPRGRAADRRTRARTKHLIVYRDVAAAA